MYLLPFIVNKDVYCLFVPLSYSEFKLEYNLPSRVSSIRFPFDYQQWCHHHH